VRGLEDRELTIKRWWCLCSSGLLIGAGVELPETRLGRATIRVPLFPACAANYHSNLIDGKSTGTSQHYSLFSLSVVWAFLS